MNSTSITNGLESTSKSSANLKSQEKLGESKRLKRFIPEHKKPDGALTFPEKVSFVFRPCLITFSGSHFFRIHVLLLINS